MERFEPKAKINVALRVVGRRKDGYHDVEMVNLPLAMSDTLEVGLAKGKEDILSVSDDRLSDPCKNLVTKAFRTFREKTGSKVYFHAVLQKRIPVEAGLGGGSSDCASALIAAHRLAGIDDPEGIRGLALSLGADVPYFLNPVPAYVTGIGEVAEPIEGIPAFHVLVAKPAQGLSTKVVYCASDEMRRLPIDCKGLINALRTKNLVEASRFAGNDLQEAACSLLPKVCELTRIMSGFGFPFIQMSGSGTSVFAIDEDVDRLEAARKKLREDGYMARITTTMPSPVR